MKVEIKKTRLTKSVLDQIIVMSQDDFTREDLHVLGWCLAKFRGQTVKYVVFYSEKTKELRKTLKFTSFDIDKDNVFRLVNNYPTFVSPCLEPRTTDEFNDLNKRLIEILAEVDEKGQFYI